MSDQLEQRIELMAELLEKYGHSPAEARELAADILRRQALVEQGCTWGGVHAEFLPQLWAQASANGNKRRLLLDITAEGDSYDEYFGHLRVEVKAAQTWAEHEGEKSRTSALLDLSSTFQEGLDRIADELNAQAMVRAKEVN